MAKKKYVKPIMVSEEFVTDSYCAVCGPTETDQGTLYAQCSGDQKIVITNRGEGGRWAALNNGNHGEAGTLMEDINNPGVWCFAGQITSGHDHTNNQGEYIYSDDPSKWGTKDTSTGTTYCNHELMATQRHHHLTNGRLVYVNNS